MAIKNFLPYVLFLLKVVTANVETNERPSFFSMPTYPFIAVVSIISLAITSWVGIFLCTDCYNAEVDSMNHPACKTQKTSHPTPEANPLAMHYGVSQPTFPVSQPYPTAPQNVNYFPAPSAPSLEPAAALYFSPQRYGAMKGYDTNVY
ncbi:uncharacterized protein LOC106883618 [Octopus bimaculoides]|uniref:Uncharacterized protein n=1 Tax=Octopus bimaculoides TaxID=37653 RepID=A0A0L8I747_OCTBM|nr:uncharacterized protein LOC106883618 [Octopus bimaculoides]XP_052822847.1 uncharacterized protein LOC106883618 [Octopus bimaculoides]|eukprot:XP_014790199.1 PREDICTED: uncharacterized protein LOC106883618 [Octopus bimaculoides]